MNTAKPIITWKAHPNPYHDGVYVLEVDASVPKGKSRTTMTYWSLNGEDGIPLFADLINNLQCELEKYFIESGLKLTRA